MYELKTSFAGDLYSFATHTPWPLISSSVMQSAGAPVAINEAFMSTAASVNFSLSRSAQRPCWKFQQQEQLRGGRFQFKIQPGNKCRINNNKIPFC
jgi:hypothetical protein